METERSPLYRKLYSIAQWSSSGSGWCSIRTHDLYLSTKRKKKLKFDYKFSIFLYNMWKFSSSMMIHVNVFLLEFSIVLQCNELTQKCCEKSFFEKQYYFLFFL